MNSIYHDSLKLNKEPVNVNTYFGQNKGGSFETFFFFILLISSLRTCYSSAIKKFELFFSLPFLYRGHIPASPNNRWSICLIGHHGYSWEGRLDFVIAVSLKKEISH